MARRQATIFINGQEVSRNIKAIAGEKRKLNNELRKLVIGTEAYEKKAAELKRVNGIIAEHNRRLRSTASAYDKMKAGLTRLAGFAAAAFTIDAIVDYGKQLFNLGTQMEVLVKKAQTVFGEALPLVTAAARENAAAMGLTTQQYVSAAAAIGDLLIPMGFQREEAANMSTALVDLSGALSEWTGGQIQSADVSRILSKALLGEREELKQLGISIQEADVKARLAEKGLSKLTGTLLQQAKATATLELITEKSVDAQTAYANNADTLVRKQAEVSAKFSEVSEKLATALIPVFDRLIDVASGVADVINVVTDTVVKLSDPIKNATSAFDEQSRRVSELETELNPLLSRYEELTEKSDKTKTEQDELAKIIQRIGILTPTAVTEIDKYGRALSINASASREFLAAEKARLQFVNQEAIADLEKQIELLETRQRIRAETARTGRGGLLNVEYDPKTLQAFRDDLAEITTTLSGARAELARLKGDNLETPDAPAPTGPSLDLEALAQEEEARQRAAKERQKAAVRAQKERAKNLQRLQDITQRYQEEARLAQLTEEDQAIARIKQRYQKEIDIALELEAKGQTQAKAQRLELLRLRDQEIERYELEQSEKKLEQELARIESDTQALTEKAIEEQIKKADFEKELRDELNQVLLSEQELQLLQLEEYYSRLLQLAEQYGFDTTDIIRAFELEQDAIRTQFADKEFKRKEEQQKARQALAAAEIETFKAVSEALNVLAGENTQLATALFAFEKGIAAAEVIINLQKELASIAASNAALGPLAVPVIAAQSTAAKIRAGFRLATIAGTVIQSVAQKKEGGYHQVRGQDDGITYRARYIGDPQTGMLPSHPVVLASEAGPEYFVSNRDLQNPKVLNYVRAIENIRLAKAPQFVEGGATASLPAAAPEVDTAGQREMLELLREISGKLDSFNAVLEDDLIVGVIKRYDKLQQVAGDKQ